MSSPRWTVPVVMVVLSGCSLSTRVAVYPVAGQPPAVQDADERACVAQVEPLHADSPRTAYAACMIARGYAATVPVEMREQNSGHDILYRVTPPTPAPSFDRVLAHVTACKNVTDGHLRSDPSVERLNTTTFWSAFLFTPLAAGTSIASAAIQTDMAEAGLRACLEPRGYTVTPWRGER